MKILFISNGYPPRQWAGTETYTAGLAQELLQRGHDVQVLCGGDWQEGAEHWNGYSDESYHGVDVRRLNLNWTLAPHPFQYMYNNPVVADFLSDFIDELQPDLVHVTSCDILSASVLDVVKDGNLPLILSLTDFWFLCPRWNLLRSDGENCNGVTTPWECLKCNLYNEKVYRWPSSVLPDSIVAPMLTEISKNPLFARQRGLRGMAGDYDERKRYLKRALTLPNHRITASNFVRDVFVANGVEAPIHVQPYGHDLSWLDNYMGKTPSETIRIGFVGQIAYWKGVHLLLEAVKSLKTENTIQDVELLIYGDVTGTDADYGSKLLEIAADMNNVQFCGTYVHDESADVFAGIDVLVVPSLWFDFPLIIHEAFATKTPVVATNLGGMAEAVEHEVNGLLFERDNVQDLVRQLRRVLEEPELLGRLIAGVPEVKAIDQEVTQLEKIYQASITETTL